MQNLCYNIVTSESISCKFVLTAKGLHTLRVNEDMYRYIFSRKIPDNRTKYGITTYYTIVSDTDGRIIGVTQIGRDGDNYANLI